jgi:hypothetical protein
MSEGPGPGDPGDDAVPVRDGFDLSHLQAVHRRLFHAVNPEAVGCGPSTHPRHRGPGDPPDGQVAMAVPARHIRTAGGKVLDVLDRAGLRGLAAGTVAAVLAELYVDLRVLRPLVHGMSNARSEATNTHLRTLTTRAYGFHTPEALISMAMLTRGGLCPPPPGRNHP